MIKIKSTQHKEKQNMLTKLHDEYHLVKHPDTPLWNESYAVVFNDINARVSALYSIGTWYHDTSIWRETFAVTMPNGEVLIGRNFGSKTNLSVLSASLSEFEIIEPEDKVRFSYSGPVWSHTLENLLQCGAYGGTTKRLSFDLTFDATSPLWNMHAEHEVDRSGVAGAMHTEQLGRCSGTLRYDDHEISINNAWSGRDHSRGPRDTDNYRNHCWINGTFPGDRCFQLYIWVMDDVEGTAVSKALVTQNNIQYPATIEHIEFVQGIEHFGKLHTVILRSELGDMKIQVKEVLATIPISMTSPFDLAMGVVNGSHALVFDEAVSIEWDGMSGLGWSERGFLNVSS